MNYSTFEKILSPARLRRYADATNNNMRRARTLYRKNILLSHALFAVINCFEVTLRNKIDQHYISIHGHDWIRKSTKGMFSDERCLKIRKRIEEKIKALGNGYSHDKLVAEMEFGFWRSLFIPNQFQAGGSSLLKIFSERPKSTPLIQYNHSYVLDELRKINELRNRIAHHEPVCFAKGSSKIDTSYARRLYQIILKLFSWMNINEKSLMHGLDHVLIVCNDINNLKIKSTSLLSSQ